MAYFAAKQCGKIGGGKVENHIAGLANGWFVWPKHAVRITHEPRSVGYTGLAERATNGRVEQISDSSPFTAMFALNHDTTHRH
jgi:hypothetical protein